MGIFTFVREPTCSTITMAELGLFFEGASFTVHRRVHEWLIKLKKSKEMLDTVFVSKHLKLSIIATSTGSNI